MSQHKKQENILSKARSVAREALVGSEAFHALSKSDQMAVYRDRVNEEYNNQVRTKGMASQMGLGDEKIVDDDRFDNDNMHEAADIMEDMMGAVDFPEFVKSLVTGVYDANVEANIEQMKAYQNLLKSATKSLSSFIKEISPEQSFAYLAENNPDEFSMSFPSMDDDDSGNQVLLTDSNGNPVDTEDSKIKAKIMDAQIQMAKEQRAMLREMLLMGMQRLVVEKGVIEAGLLIDIKSQAQVNKTERGQVSQERKSSSWHMGGGKTRHGRNNGTLGLGISASKGQKSQVRVASATGMQSDSLNAKLTGNVKIEFKSDYFKLDNFAKMYGGISDDERDDAKKAKK